MRNGKKRATRLVRKRVGGWIVSCMITGLLLVAAMLLAQSLALHGQEIQSSGSRPVQRPGSAVSFLYYVLKSSSGFTLARASRGVNNQPTSAPQILASFGRFGQNTTDNVLDMQLSSDKQYLAVDGTGSDYEQVWIFDTLQHKLKPEPVGASGAFLHWLPGGSDSFLFRPMFPQGPDAPLKNGVWNPGLWIVNAASGKITNFDIHTSSTSLVDAISTPDGSKIIYSTTDGPGTGSSIWSMKRDGTQRVQLLRLADAPQSIAGMFAWAPDGHTLAYERLADSPTPFLPAGIWTMESDGSHQHYLADGDGGHGFTLNWSPDGKAIAFVTRTNLDEKMADLQAQALQSAVEVVDVQNGKTRLLTGPAQTGMQINLHPTWSADGSRITFVACNPLNPVVGGSLRYWSLGAGAAMTRPSALPLSRPLLRVIAFQ